MKCANCGETNFFVGPPVTIPVAWVRMENGNFIVTYKDGIESEWTCMKCGYVVKKVIDCDNKTTCIKALRTPICLTREDIRKYAETGASPKEVLSNPSKYSI